MFEIIGVEMNEIKRITGILHTYSKKAKEQILQVGSTIFQSEGISGLEEELFPCMDELIKNAVKANYKFVLIIEKLVDRLKTEYSDISDEKVEEMISDIIKNKDVYDITAAEIAETENISKTVREILNEESVQLKIKNSAYEKNCEISDADVERLNSLKKINRIHTLLSKRKVKVIIKIESDNQFIFIEVTNTAPIIAKDLNRIYAKRDEFKIYRDENREHEFFINNLDTSESGFGLGYATIDSTLANMGLDPFKTIQILAASDTTVILSIPIDIMKSRVV